MLSSAFLVEPSMHATPQLQVPHCWLLPALAVPFWLFLEVDYKLHLSTYRFPIQLLYEMRDNRIEYWHYCRFRNGALIIVDFKTSCSNVMVLLSTC
mmetsp:Transcript_12978/g.17706  ORF Transcript_12978/g.17706 Transcript_12978/m.17706 type:complete len:96 (+) Transcript_12978:789-1076(+)